MAIFLHVCVSAKRHTQCHAQPSAYSKNSKFLQIREFTIKISQNNGSKVQKFFSHFDRFRGKRNIGRLSDTVYLSQNGNFSALVDYNHIQVRAFILF